VHGLIFGSIIGAGIISILIAPMVSRMLRFFPPVVTGTIIAVIGISLMRVGINWIFGNPVGPTAPNVVNPEHLKWLAEAQMQRGAPVRRCPRAQGLCHGAHRAQPQIRRPHVVWASRPGAGVHPADRQVRQGLHRQHLGAAGHRHRRRGGGGHGPDELRQSGQGPVVRPGAAVRDCHAPCSTPS
jgi:hypothetical protein